MRWLLKLFLFGGAAVAILLVAAVSWFFFYSRDLPDVTRLAQFAPATKVSVSDPCLEAGTITASDAEAAKSAPLGVADNDVVPGVP